MSAAPYWQPPPAALPTKPLGGSFSFLAIATQLSLLLYLGLVCYVAIVSLEGLALIDALEAGTGTATQAESLETRTRALAAMAVVLYLLTATLFICWMYTLRTSASVAPEAMRHSAGWTVGGWFVPILNLFRPYQIMVDLWRGMVRPARPFQGPGQPPVPVLVTLWWGAFLVTSVGGRLAVATVPAQADTFDQARQAFQTELLVDAVSVVAAVLAIGVLRMYTARARATPPPMPWTPIPNVWPSAASPRPDAQFPYGRPVNAPQPGVGQVPPGPPGVPMPGGYGPPRPQQWPAPPQ